MEQPDWNNDPILKKFMMMLPHQGEWAEIYTLKHLEIKRAKAKEEKRRDRERKKAKLVEIASTTSQPLSS
jgi:hypothetical protein